MTANDRFHILSVVGARPNFMKIAPIIRAFDRHGGFRSTLVHTGQHYDVAMKTAFFVELDIPEPDIDLGVGSGSHAVQTAEVMRRFEPELERLAPDAVLVVGDVNSTLACALVAAKRGVPVVHVEAGLRSFDRAMPEEINRVLTDQLADLLFTTEAGATDNLRREGVDATRVRFVGNVMIDTLMHFRACCPPPERVLKRFGVPFVERSDEGYAVLTIHRPSNVDAPGILAALAETMAEVSAFLPIVFPVHPRTRARIDACGLQDTFGGRVAFLPPLGYLEMLGLTSGSRIVLTDSGGLQEETTALGVPCITLRSNTERPVTVTEGTNTVVGTERKPILDCVADVLNTGGKAGRIPELWDGCAADRIVREIEEWMRDKFLNSV